MLDHATPGPLCHTAAEGWQYALVEVEAVVEGGGGGQQRANDSVVRELEGRIDELAGQLGLVAAGEFGGKVAAYLRRFNPSLLLRLVEQNKQRAT